MGVVTVVAKIFLVVLNVLFGIFAVLFITIGAVFEFGMVLFNQYGRPYLDELIAGQSNDTGGGGSNISEQDLQAIFDALQIVAIPLLVAGCVLFVFTFCGCCGVCCNNKILLMVYAILISILTAAFIALGVWIYFEKEKVIKESEHHMVLWLQREYVNETSTDLCSLTINFLNILGQCCGVRNYTDFDDYPKVVTMTVSGTTVTQTQQIPATCCKGLTIDNPVPSDMSCSTSPTPSTTNMDKGCYDDFLMSYLKEYSDYIAYGGIGFLVFMLMMTIFAWLVYFTVEAAPKKKVSYV